ncbi:MAG: rhodanese-like domain-containing protein [Psychromonas sp.]|nr:rhodanese-like domain-containing protein [Psychromonas sp.]
MKFNNAIHILMLVLFSAFTQVAQADIKTVAPETLLELIQKQQAPLILDVRSANEFAQGHISGAINISYELLTEEQQLNAYKDREIIIYCRSGRRAQIASKILQDKGFKQLTELNGDMLEWQKKHYPVAFF